MKWNWQQADWPHFRYDKAKIEALENKFLKNSGMLLGTFKHLDIDDKNHLIVELLSSEAIKTSEIEGEYLNRASVQSSIRKHFGLQADNRKIPKAEQGIAELMMNLFETFAHTLNHDQLFIWHAMLTKGYDNLQDVGKYRTHKEAMQVISGPLHKPKVHFEAPPSHKVSKEMQRFIKWFNDTAPDGKAPLPALTRAGIAHLYFVCIHPFEDGNGRISRALAEKALAQSVGKPTLIALSYTITKHKKAYYDELEKANKQNEINRWLRYFSQTITDAQTYTLRHFEFMVAKARFYDHFKGLFNPRQSKVIARMFSEGLDGFKGGLSAENYLSITKTTRATATRDLQDLVAKGALTKAGELRYTRYYLAISLK